ncbi:MAG: ABC transporter permease subunit [Anaerolineae bacterium]|nr:ABC transporter permease subunit [Anaerolineae bacterium]
MTQIPLGLKNTALAFDWKKWIGILPFILFAALFLFLPSLQLLAGSFSTPDGNFTFANIIQLFKEKFILDAYWLSIRISAATALGGGFWFLLAYAVTAGGLPKSIRTALITFSGVASNFAGVPLAFAFIATLGRTGFVTALIETLFGVNIYKDTSFSLYGFAGLSFTYLYFQFPLMVLIMAPALDGLKREWREAAENLGASTLQYWLRVAFPILLPSILGSMILLFGNAFGAYATAYALTGGRLGIITIQIGAQIRGDVLHNPELGYAMAMGMVVVMGVSLAGYSWLQHKSERWLR